MVHVITLAFNNPRILRQSIDRFYETRNHALPITHWLVDQKYPLPSHDAVSQEINRVAEQYGCRVISPGQNLGLHRGWNWASEQIGVKDEDILIGYDPDTYPLDPGWDMALVTALQDPVVGWASLWNTACPEEFGPNNKTFRRKRIAQIEVRLLDQPIVNSICAWRASYLRAAGGLQEPTNFYGHLECHMWPALKAQGLEWAVLPGWRECNRLNLTQDREYLWWKWRHAHLKDWPGDFESYVRAECPPPSDFRA
jgi:hypothetical protein